MSVLAPNPQILYRQVYTRDQHQSWSRGTTSSLQKTSGLFHSDSKTRNWNKISKRDLRAEGGFSWPNFSKPTTIEMEHINDSDQLDQILNQAKEASQPVVIDWMASWCRKCIYLKPMMEKLAAEFDAKTKFYYVDVNTVSKDLVKRGNITKMPTIQVWKDGEMKEEVIGGHKAWLVIEEVKEMINKFI